MTSTPSALTAIVFVNPVPWARAQMAFTLAFHIISYATGMLRDSCAGSGRCAAGPTADRSADQHRPSVLGHHGRPWDAAFLLSVWYAVSWIFRRRMPQTKWFLRAAAVSGVAAVITMEAGWVLTEVSAQSEEAAG